MDPKPFYLSKTFWVNLIMAICPSIPGAGPFVSSHPMIIVEIFAAVNIALRFVTKSGISIS